MPDLQANEWAERWNIARQKALQRPDLAGGTASIAELARRTGNAWYAKSRHDHLLSSYLKLDAHAIMKRSGIGPVTIERILNIVEAAVTMGPMEVIQPDKPSAPLSRLEEWGVPEHFPVSVLLRLPARVLGFCEQAQIQSLGDLLRQTEALGEKGLLATRNLGRKSVAELLDLVEALRQGNRQEAGRWLPLSENGPGFSLGVAVKQLIADLDQRQRPMLEHRLVQGMTLEEAARRFEVTRERVRQIARDFLLGPLERLLDTFPVEQNELFQLWMSGVAPTDHLGAFTTETDRLLADSALRELFSERPEAVAAKLDRELQFETLSEKMKSLPDFHLLGVDLQLFLEREVPAEHHGLFLEYLLEKNGFRFDHETGSVCAENPSLRRLIFSLLLEENNAIPATSLLLVVRQAKAFESLTVDDLKGRYRRWVQNYSELTWNKVIWTE